MSHILDQVDSTTQKLNVLFDELGLSHAQRQARLDTLQKAISEAMDSQLDLTQQERDSLYSKCEQLQSIIQSMFVALKDVNPRSILGSAAESLLTRNIDPPLNTMLQSLEAAHAKVEQSFTNRLLEVNGYLSKLKSMSEILDGMSVNDTTIINMPSIMPEAAGVKGVVDDLNNDLNNLDVSNKRISDLQNEVKRWEAEYQHRVRQVADTAADIVSLWAELGVPQDELDTVILDNYKTSPEILGVKTADIDRILRLKDVLEDEKAERLQRLETLKADVSRLWQKLSEDEHYTADFSYNHQGFTKQALEAYTEELDRLNEKKKEHIQLFIQEARDELQGLWAQLYFSEQETSSFTPAWSDIYTDASLEAHENEISRLKEMVQERKHILHLLDSYHELQKDEKVLEESSHDASRLFSRGGTGGGRRDPGRLLREEQMRKRIAKRKPRVVQELRVGLEAWREEHGGIAFTVYGEDYLDRIKQEEENLMPKTTPRRKPLIPGTTGSVSRSATTTRSISGSAVPSSSSNIASSRKPTQQQQQRSVTLPNVSSPTRRANNGATSSRPLVTPSTSQFMPQSVPRYQHASFSSSSSSVYPANTTNSRVTKASHTQTRVPSTVSSTSTGARRLRSDLSYQAPPKMQPIVHVKPPLRTNKPTQPVSYGKEPRQEPRQAPAAACQSSAAKNEQRSPSPVLSRSPVRAPIRSPIRSPVRAPVRAPVEAPVRSPESSPIHFFPTKSPVQSPVQSPVRSPIRSPIRSPTRIPVATKSSDKENCSPTRLKLHPMMSPVKLAPPTSASKPLSKMNTSTNGLLSSPLMENPNATDIFTSDEEFEDPNYLRWRQTQIEQLSNSPSRAGDRGD